MKHLDKYNILTDSQFRFRTQHPCESQLFVTINDIAKAMDVKLQVDAAILDFSKVFDKVAHSRLLYKLDYYGIRGKLHSWLSSFQLIVALSKLWLMGLNHLLVKLHQVFLRAVSLALFCY